MNPLIRKLMGFNTLSGADREALDALCGSVVERRSGAHLIREGEQPASVFLLIDGWAFRYKYTENGGRQILAFLLPGDLCDPQVFILEQMDHSIALLSDARVVEIPKKVIVALTEDHPAIARALWWSALVDEAVLREWLVNMGRRDARARLAHLFCELWMRMCHVGLSDDGAFSLPLTQEQLGDTVGLTSVHVNRVLQGMRTEGLITMQSKTLTILDTERMTMIAGFDPKYLHFRRRRAANSAAVDQGC